MSELVAYFEAQNAEKREWLAAGPERYCTMFDVTPEAIAELAAEGITTVEEYVVDEMRNTYSDYFKDVHGFRPHVDVSEWTKEQLDEEFDYLGREMEHVMAADAEREAEAIAEFEKNIAATMAAGNVDRETAIRWLRDAEEDGGAMDGTDGYFEYSNGLPYGYLAKAA